MATHKVTGERYIGYTSRNLSRRKSYHIKGAINGYGPGKFAEAIARDGRDAFIWDTLATFDNAIDALAAEQNLIRELRPEYNGTKGGGLYKPLIHSPETLERLRALGHEKIETFRRYAHLGPAASARRVVCLDDGKEYPSAKAAGRAYGISASSITTVCGRSKTRRTAGGKVFRHYGDHLGGKEEAQKIHRTPWRNGTNPYPGVHPHISDGTNTGRWRARISAPFVDENGMERRKSYSLGIFTTPEEARVAVERARRILKSGGTLQ